MYYEEAEVKEYFRKDSKGNKKPYYQIGIKKKSKFNKPTTVALVDIAEIKEIAKNTDVNKYSELKANYNSTSEELVEIKQQLQEAKATIESLTSELKNLKEEKVQLQEDLLTEKDKHKELIEAANNNVIEAKDRIEELQKEHKEELAELNFKLNNEKDLTKSLLVVRSDLLNRNLINRIRNKEPDSSKKVAELKKLPEDVEANISKE